MKRIIFYCGEDKLKEVPLTEGAIPFTEDAVVIDGRSYAVQKRAFVYGDSTVVVILKVEPLE